MGYNMKRGAAPKFKELGSSPLPDKEKGFMQPPYKDTVEGTRPYEKRQAYHGFKVQPDIPVKPKDKEMKEFSDLEKYDDDKS